MGIKRLKRPRDPVARAKLILDIATGEVEDRVEDGKNPAAVALGKLGGAKGGKARAKKLSDKQKSLIGKNGAFIRWNKK